MHIIDYSLSSALFGVALIFAGADKNAPASERADAKEAEVKDHAADTRKRAWTILQHSTYPQVTRQEIECPSAADKEKPDRKCTEIIYEYQ